MSRHESVSCDACFKSNFRGKRYKCLICYDFDLCAVCYEAGARTSRHLRSHPMQCILTHVDHDLFFGGDNSDVTTYMPQSFTCPFCGKLGLTEKTLVEHIATCPDNSNPNSQVVCPICSSMPGGDPHHVTDDLVSHISLEHAESGGGGGGGRVRPPARSAAASSSAMDEVVAAADFFSTQPANPGSSSSSGHLSRSAAMRRVPHVMRGGAAASGGGGSRARRTGNFQSQAAVSGASSIFEGNNRLLQSRVDFPGGLPPPPLQTSADFLGSRSAASAADPLAELLTQLSGLRRPGSRGHALLPVEPGQPASRDAPFVLPVAQRGGLTASRGGRVSSRGIGGTAINREARAGHASVETANRGPESTGRASSNMSAGLGSGPQDVEAVRKAADGKYLLDLENDEDEGEGEDKLQMSLVVEERRLFVLQLLRDSLRGQDEVDPLTADNSV